MTPTLVTATAALLSFSLFPAAFAAPSNNALLLERVDTTVTCPTNNGQPYTASSGKSYLIECSVDHAGGDMGGVVYATTLSQCIESCDSTAGCVAFSWVSTTNGNNNPCYLKSSVGAANANAGVMGGKFVAIASSSTKVVTTTSLTSTKAPTVTIRTSTATTSSSAPANSNVVCPTNNGQTYTAADGRLFLVECGIDHAGGDLSNLAATSLSQCIEGCASTTGCVAFSWVATSNGPSNPCYLKSSVGASNANAGIMGGKLVSTAVTSSAVTTTRSSTSATRTSAIATTTAVGGGTATNLPVGWSYYGCFVDNVNGRILLQANNLPGQTIETCIATCAAAGYIAAGVEYSTECSCGSAIYSGGVRAASDTECNMPCGGSPQELCGAGNRMSIYSTGPLSTFRPPSAQTSGLPTGWSYYGCVTDDTNSRTLDYQIIYDTTNSPNVCLELCASYGFMAAGLEYGNQCFCGDASTRAASTSVAAPESDCNTICPGNATSVCGAGNRINYYIYNATTPLYSFSYPTGAAAGNYQFLIGGLVVPLIASQGTNGKVYFIEKHGTSVNGTGAYELDVSLVDQGIPAAWREMNGLKTDVFCSAGLTLPDKVGRQINIGGWSGDSTYGVRLYWPDGSPGVKSVNDWQEDYTTVKLQKGRWYPSAMIMANGSILVVGGEDGSNGKAVPSLEILPLPAGGQVITQDFLQRTDPYNLYPFLYVLPSGGIFIAYFNEARIMDPVTFATIKVLPKIPCHITNLIGGRTYPLEGTSAIMPQRAPYTDYVTILLCGGSTPDNQALDNCVSIQPDAPDPKWVLERMPSKRVMPCVSALPDGTYLVVNGATAGQAGFGLASEGNHNALIYDPRKVVGSRFSVAANTTLSRLYHSEAILLSDGRVLISGSDPEAAPLIQEYRVETFTPPYLLNGKAKPTFTMSSKDWTYGQVITFTVTAPAGGAVTVSLMGAESSTHGNSMGQRVIMPAVTCAGTKCSVTAPPNANICPPGWFQVFVLDGPTPSNSQYVRIGGDPAKLGNWPNFPAFDIPGL